MSNLTPNGETTVLNALLTGRFVSLHTGDPANTGANEIVGKGYARQGMSFTGSGSDPTVYANNAIVQFPVATAAWGTITHFGIWSAATGGNLLAKGTVTTPREILTDDIARYPVGSLQVSAN